MPNTLSDYDVTQAMLTFGGSFVRNFAMTFRCADASNQARMKLAFPEYFEKYEELALLKRAQQEQAK